LYNILSRQAEASGLVFTTQKQRKPFSTVVDERLFELFFHNNPEEKNDALSSPFGKEIMEIMSELKSAIIARAKQLYPDSRLI